MKKGSLFGPYVAVTALVLMLMVALVTQAPTSEAVSCDPLELSSCIDAVTSSRPPSPTCCAKLKEQRPCLCGYLKDPILRQYMSTSAAKKISTACSIPFPHC
ncbi:hypothetical protein K2173_001263 [Erythroxylum novogranatense]|uniref:Bifunctional inhibitor/plant lipid transfer protein/seed storage helical domain-containing protein n=1 Tax=Erythroxylum novogranatense TaxID=1862640 RepID=A0AAV8T3F6_9ROSI|nr:hypothetical protein K2173_001263 [Erythroxylum novogranatense]